MAAAVVAPAGCRYVYQRVVPPTAGLVLQALHERLPTPTIRVAYVESAALPGAAADILRGEARVPLHTVESLRRIGPAELDLTDAEVFPARRLRGPDAAFYRARRDRVDAAARVVVEHRWLVNRGPSLVALLHPIAPEQAVPVPLPDVKPTDDGFVTVLPADPKRAPYLNVQLWIVHRGGREPVVPRLWAGDVELAVLPAGRSGRGYSSGSKRFAPPTGAVPLRVVPKAGTYGGKLAIAVTSWYLPATGAAE